VQASILEDYLTECRDLVLAEIREIIPSNRYRTILYDLMLEYPLRLGKGFRPALCIATCRALGGRLQDVLQTAAVLELYHNAFLVHDDVEDGSLMRRGNPTLHQDYGVPIAVNVGDGMNALCLQPLLDNMNLLGMGKALRILQIVSRMTRESVEGQAMELDWVRRGRWGLRDREYCLMSYKKTCWYTFIAPMQVGGIVNGATPSQLALLRKYAVYVGVAFQIQDDVLNLTADERYGKEIGGDLCRADYSPAHPGATAHRKNRGRHSLPV
jgi:geranylgeranyl diphosphate synthase, type II